MEIILQGSNIDNFIDSQIKAIQDRNTNISNDRKAAEEAAIISLVRQFQNELSTFIDTAVQSSLPLQFLPPKELSVYSVCASFVYSEVTGYLRRTPTGWEITYLDQIVGTDSENLQKQLLIELSKIREKVAQNKK